MYGRFRYSDLKKRSDAKRKQRHPRSEIGAFLLALDFHCPLGAKSALGNHAGLGHQPVANELACEVSSPVFRDHLLFSARMSRMYCGSSLASGSHIMGTNDTKGWSELLDVALFEANRTNLRKRMEHATDAIHRRMEELRNDEDASSNSERLALRNALETLADLQKIAYTRKPSGRVSRENGRTISGQF